VIVTEEGEGRSTAKLISFSAATTTNNVMAKSTLPVQWKTPEMLDNMPSTPSSDVYGLALLLWHIHTGQQPYHQLSSDEIETAIAQGQRQRTDDMEHKDQQLLHKCWNPNPSARPSAAEFIVFLQPSQELLKARQMDKKDEEDIYNDS